MNYEMALQAGRLRIELFRASERAFALAWNPACDHQLHPAVHLWARQSGHRSNLFLHLGIILAIFGMMLARAL
jgi:hypothetical protein